MQRCHLGDGLYAGVSLDSPEGQHDGSLHGHRYFRCAPNCGVLLPARALCKPGPSVPACATPAGVVESLQTQIT